jgi:hypothetical protein
LIKESSIHAYKHYLIQGNAMTRDFSRLTRPHYPIPSFVNDALLSQEKRLNQMLEELEAGDRYMGMEYTPKQRID